MMKKIAVINDLSGLGKCSLTAAIPVISVMGVQACPFPTAVLSNQTGYETYFCEDLTRQMTPYMEQWKKRGFIPDGIYTGFLSDEKQADKILKFMDLFAGEETLILTDPVMGDDGEVYPIYTEGLRSRFRELVSRSYVITPNLTEALLLLYGKEKIVIPKEVRDMFEIEPGDSLMLMADKDRGIAIVAFDGMIDFMRTMTETAQEMEEGGAK